MKSMEVNSTIVEYGKSAIAMGGGALVIVLTLYIGKELVSGIYQMMLPEKASEYTQTVGPEK